MSDGRIGTVIAGRYKVEELIAKRPVAEVYRGTDTVGKRAVAIKILGDGSDVVRKRFLREAQAMVGLSHPNIVAVYGSGEDHEQSYIVSEPAFGKPLTAAREGMSIERGIETFIHVLEAIEYAHAQHIVHRDIKPENIVVLDDGTVKVMDFGLSRRFVDVAPGVSETGEIASAIAYLPPERFLGKPTDARSDLYSVGCVMYEFFVGEPPFQSSNDDLVAVIFAHVNEPPVPPRSRNPRVPAALERIILKLLEKDPQNRYASAHEARVELEALLAKKPAGAGAPPADVQALLSRTTQAAPAGAMTELLDRTLKPAQVLREAQKDVLAAMLATRKRDYAEMVRAYRAALGGFKQINNDLEYARTAVKFATAAIEKNAQGEPSAREELESVISALSEALPILRGRRSFAEVEEGERALYALQRLRVNAHSP